MGCTVALIEKECLRYDREFLLRLRSSVESQRKPIGLPQMPEIIIDMVSMLFMLIFFLIKDYYIYFDWQAVVATSVD